MDPDESIRDKIQYKVKTDEKKGICVKVEYKQDYSEDEGFFFQDIDEVATQFEVMFDRLVEYSKTNINLGRRRSDEEQAYDWSTDTVLQTVSLTEWGNFSIVQHDEGKVVSYFSIQSLDNFTLFNFTISRADMGEKVTANSMKVDVLITNFPWMRNDTNLALLSSVKSKLKIKMAYDEEATISAATAADVTASDRNNEDSTNHDSNNLQPHDFSAASRATQDVHIPYDDAIDDIGFVPFGEYHWEDLADVSENVFLDFDGDGDMDVSCETASDSSSSEIISNCVNITGSQHVVVEEVKDTIRVVATSPPAEGNDTFQLIAYSFVGNAAHNASEIYWDPQTGIGYKSAAAESTCLYALQNIVASVAVSYTLIGALL